MTAERPDSVGDVCSINRLPPNKLRLRAFEMVGLRRARRIAALY